MRKETKGNNTRSHDWAKKGPKLRSVTAFLSKAEWIDETDRCERSGISFGEKSSCYWLWNVLRVWFFLKHRCNHRSKQIETVWFHHISCGSWTEQVCNPFVQRRHHVSTSVPVWSNWTQNWRQKTWNGNFYAARKRNHCCEEGQNSPP